MKVYVVEVFSRNDEYNEYSSGVLNVFAKEDKAIDFAREYAFKNAKYYGYIVEEKTQDNVKYLCCISNDPDNTEAEYIKCEVITVTEHELKED